MSKRAVVNPTLSRPVPSSSNWYMNVIPQEVNWDDDTQSLDIGVFDIWASERERAKGRKGQSVIIPLLVNPQCIPLWIQSLVFESICYVRLRRILCRVGKEGSAGSEIRMSHGNKSIDMVSYHSLPLRFYQYWSSASLVKLHATWQVPPLTSHILLFSISPDKRHRHCMFQEQGEGVRNDMSTKNKNNKGNPTDADADTDQT